MGVLFQYKVAFESCYVLNNDESDMPFSQRLGSSQAL